MVNKTAKPEDFAAALLKRFNISPPVNLHDLASKIGLKICEVESEGFESTLLRSSNRLKGIVAVDRRIREVSRKRFCIAHEIAHYILPGHGEENCICKKGDIEAWGQNISEHEIAANQFAAELLLPTSHILPIIQRECATIKAAKIISGDFQTSLTAAAMKCVGVTSENCALVVIDNKAIRWWKPSNSFIHYIRRGEISSDSLASKLFSGEESFEQDGAVPAGTWLTYVSTDAKVWEDSIILPSYNRVLSIVTITKALS